MRARAFEETWSCQPNLIVHHISQLARKMEGSERRSKERCRHGELQYGSLVDCRGLLSLLVVRISMLRDW